MVAQARFPVMGTHAHVVVHAPEPRAAGLVSLAVARLDDLHRRWTRFEPTSELAQLNQAEGKPTIVSADTYRVIRHAVDAWHLTGGRFDPSVHDILCDLGYDRSFADQTPCPRATPRPAPGCAGIGFDPHVRAITLPRGVALDLGGIGKGAAADLVADELLAAGADGVCINVGGDVRADGRAPNDGGWVIGLELPGARDTSVRRVALRRGAVCTSTRLRRQWHDRAGAPHHHLVDPATGRATNGLASVTVIGARAAQAEVLTKVIFVAGADEAADRVIENGCVAAIVDDRGATTWVGPIEEMAV